MKKRERWAGRSAQVQVRYEQLRSQALGRIGGVGSFYVEDFGMVMREGMASWMMRCAFGRRWDIGPRFNGSMGEAPSSWESEMTTVLTDWALERIEGELRA